MAQAHKTSRWTRQLRGLYAVTPDIVDIGVLVAKVEAAIAGGAQAIQYRNKAAGHALRRKQAAMLARVCGGGGALFIVNDDVALAREVGAAGVHLGEDDGDFARARESLGESMLIGVSCYNDLARAKRLVAEGADYVAFGSFFLPRPSPARGAPNLRCFTARGRCASRWSPSAASRPKTAARWCEAGADALAVISAVFDHDDLAQVTRAAAAIVGCFDADPKSAS